MEVGVGLTSDICRFLGPISQPEKFGRVYPRPSACEKYTPKVAEEHFGEGEIALNCVFNSPLPLRHRFDV